MNVRITSAALRGRPGAVAATRFRALLPSAGAQPGLERRPMRLRTGDPRYHLHGRGGDAGAAADDSLWAARELRGGVSDWGGLSNTRDFGHL